MEEDGFTLYWNKKKKRTIKNYNFLKESNSNVITNQMKIFNDFHGDVDINKIESIMNWIRPNACSYSEQIIDVILRLSDNRKIIQMEIYGIGSISTKKSPGALQLSVAIDIINQLKRNYSELKVVIQEPIFTKTEVEYLSNKGYIVTKSEEFSSHMFCKAVDSSCLKNDAILLCYMIHGEWSMLDEFLSNYWSKNDLKRIIIIGNSLIKLDIHPHYSHMPDRVKTFAKITEEFRIIEDDNAFSNTSIIWVNHEKLKQIKLDN